MVDGVLLERVRPLAAVSLHVLLWRVQLPAVLGALGREQRLRAHAGRFESYVGHRAGSDHVTQRHGRDYTSRHAEHMIAQCPIHRCCGGEKHELHDKVTTRSAGGEGAGAPNEGHG